MEVVLIMLQMTTGISNRKVTKNNNNALADCLIMGPEYRYTFGSIEILSWRFCVKLLICTFVQESSYFSEPAVETD